MDLTKLTHWSYLFQIYTYEQLSWPTLIGLLVIFVGSIVLAIYSHKKVKNSSGVMKVVWQKLTAWGWSTGLVGLLLVSFRAATAMYLSARLWLLLWLLIILVWLGYILFYRLSIVPKKQAEREKNIEYNKWLPKPKK
ncbi:MAG: hypothetical protein WC465_03420 [Patescibacteria group bacterium]